VVEQHASIPNTSNSLVTKIRKMSMMPNIRDDAINALLDLQRVHQLRHLHPAIQRHFIKVSTACYGRLLVRSLHQWVGKLLASDSCQVPSLPTEWLQQAAI
jgi:hypothetical protein